MSGEILSSLGRFGPGILWRARAPRGSGWRASQGPVRERRRRVTVVVRWVVCSLVVCSLVFGAQRGLNLVRVEHDGRRRVGKREEGGVTGITCFDSGGYDPINSIRY
jgi:hypothetical protein